MHAVARRLTPDTTPHHPVRLPLARVWAAHVAAARWTDLPQQVRHEAVRCQLNWLAVALGGSRSPTVHRALAAALAMGAGGHATLVGHAPTLDPLQAAFLNSLAASAQAYDDTHLPTITHPGAPVVAAAWAVAGERARQGQPVHAPALLLAIVLGVELQCRLSNAVIAGGRGAHLGWYTTGISGGVGAAVAAASLMGLAPGQLTAAIGLAASQAGGVRATHGSMATAFVPACAARNGLGSAYLAREGFTCTDHVIEGPNGLFDVLSPHCEPARMTDGLGRQFEMLANAYKPYPCGIVIHAAIDACLEVGRAQHLTEPGIERLELAVHPSTLNLCGRRLPQTELDAQVSLFHWAASALLHPGQWVRAASAESVRDPACRALQWKIQATADPALGRAQARARLTLAGGEVREAMVLQATASADKPMTDAQLDDKFLKLAGTVLPDARARALLEQCRTLDAPGADPMAVLQAAR